MKNISGRICLSAKLFGYLRVPFVERMVQSAKVGSCVRDEQALNAIAADVINNHGGESSIYHWPWDNYKSRYG